MLLAELVLQNPSFWKCKPYPSPLPFLNEKYFLNYSFFFIFSYIKQSLGSKDDKFLLKRGGGVRLGLPTSPNNKFCHKYCRKMYFNKFNFLSSNKFDCKIRKTFCEMILKIRQ